MGSKTKSKENSQLNNQTVENPQINYYTEEMVEVPLWRSSPFYTGLMIGGTMGGILIGKDLGYLLSRGIAAPGSIWRRVAATVGAVAGAFLVPTILGKLGLSRKVLIPKRELSGEGIMYENVGLTGAIALLTHALSLVLKIPIDYANWEAAVQEYEEQQRRQEEEEQRRREYLV